MSTGSTRRISLATNVTGKKQKGITASFFLVRIQRNGTISQCLRNKKVYSSEKQGNKITYCFRRKVDSESHRCAAQLQIRNSDNFK